MPTTFFFLLLCSPKILTSPSLEMNENSILKYFMPVKFIKQQEISKPELHKNWLPLNLRHH